MAKVDFDKLYNEKKWSGWMAAVLAAHAVFKVVVAFARGVTPFDAVVTGSLAAMCLLNYVRISVKIEREHAAQIKRRKSKTKKRQTANWNTGAYDAEAWNDPVDPATSSFDGVDGRSHSIPSDEDLDGFAPVASSYKPPRDASKRGSPIVIGMGIGAGCLALLWASIWVVVNAHNWFDSPPPSIAEWDDIEMPKSGVMIKMPESTGGVIEDDFRKVIRGTVEHVVRQHGSRAFIAINSQPVIDLKGKAPTEEVVAAARRKWGMKVALDGRYSDARSDAAAVVDGLSNDKPIYGFRTHVRAKSVGNYRIEGLSLFLPDGQALDLQYWTKAKDPAAEADAFFDTLQFLPKRPKQAKTVAAKTADPLVPNSRTEPPKRTEPDWENLAWNQLQRELARLPKPPGRPPDVRNEFVDFLTPLPEPEDFKTDVGVRSGVPFTSRNTRGGMSRPQVVVFPDGPNLAPRYHTLMADFEASGFGVIVAAPMIAEGAVQPFNGYLDAAARAQVFIKEDVGTYRSTDRFRRNESWPIPTYVVGFGSGGHIAALLAMDRTGFEPRSTVSIDGGYADLKSIFGDSIPIDDTPHAIAGRSIVARLDEMDADHTLFLLGDDRPAMRTLAALRRGAHPFHEWTRGDLLAIEVDKRQPRLAVIDLSDESNTEAGVLAALQTTLQHWAADAGRNITIQRDTLARTPAIAPLDSPQREVVKLRLGTGIPPYEGAETPSAEPSNDSAERVTYIQLLANADEAINEEFRPLGRDTRPQDELLDDFGRDVTTLRRRIERPTYDPDLSLSGVFVRAAKESDTGKPFQGPRPALLYLHGGLKPDPRDVAVVKAFVDNGFHVFSPVYRSETRSRNDRFSAFLTEANDAATAAHWLASHDDVDADHVYALGVDTGGHVAALLSLRDVPLRSTASIDGVCDPETEGSELFTVYARSEDADRLRSLRQNLPDMQREHVLYFTREAMSKAGTLERSYKRLTKAAHELAVDTLIAANPGRKGFSGPTRLEARRYGIGNTPKDLFGCLLVDGRDRAVRERSGPYADQVRGLVDEYLQRCLNHVRGKHLPRL